MELSINKHPYNRAGISGYSFLSKVLVFLLLGVLVSCYFFPFEFTFLPRGLNTKIILAVIAFPLIAIDVLVKRTTDMDRDILFTTVIALVFSVIGYVSVDINYSDDRSYANYIISFATWFLAAYATCHFVREIHGYLSFELLVNYLVAICVAQCFLALAIDYNVGVKSFVDAYISQDTVADVKFLNEVDRLYGIGAAVDVAGTRFSIVLIALAAVLNDLRYKEDRGMQVALYWSAFIAIAVIGNMISRTTTVGVGMALFYLLCKSNIFQQKLSLRSLKNWFSIVVITVLLVLVAVYYYRTDAVVQEQLRFAFEGFFNWVERGEWKTDSTDRLNSVMWKWPEPTDIKTWVIGQATFEDWHAVGTDIGYCRFIFYNGLLGLGTFSLFFVYNAWACAQRFPSYKLFFILLLALSFVIWMKVATDLFIIYALFFCIDREEKLAV